MENLLKLQIEYLLLLQNFRDTTHGIFDWLFCHITMFGEYCLAMLIMALFYWIINKKCGIYIIWNFFGGLLINQFIKIAACIYRPWILDSRIKPVKEAMKMATGYSFPSGHTAIATGTFGALAVSFWNNKITRYSLIALILLVGFSRNYLGVHTPQDVVISLIVGATLLYLTEQILKWVDNGKNRDLFVYIFMLLLGGLLIIYTEFKHYPIDYLNGAILVDPVKMRFESFPKAGFAIGAFTGWLIERRFINFEPPKGSIFAKLGIYLIGAIILYFLQENLTTIFLNFMPIAIGRFSSCFIISLFITAIYPLIIKFYNTKTLSKD